MGQLTLILSVFVSVFFVACATRPVIESSSTHLFPPGTYEQRITLTPTSPNLNSQAFRGILSVKPEKIEVVGLSPFGTTVFHIQEDIASQKLKIDIYMEDLKRFENRIHDYYTVMRSVLFHPRKGRPQQIPVNTKEGGKLLTVKKYDTSGIPQELIFEAESHRISILVKSYELVH